MEIICKSETLNNRDAYKMSHSGSVISIKNVPDGEIIDPVEYLVYRDIDSKGEEKEILAIKDSDGKIYACQSATFRREFMDMAESFWPDFRFIKASGVSKGGREFVTCELE